MDTAKQLPASVIDAFHLMWDNFPEPVTLVHKSREVMAINKWHKTAGFLSPGMNCAKIGDPTLHKGCLGNKALSSGQTTYTHKESPDGEQIAFWMPIDGYPEFFVHFGVGISINYKKGEPKDFLKKIDG